MIVNFLISIDELLSIQKENMVGLPTLIVAIKVYFLDML